MKEIELPEFSVIVVSWVGKIDGVGMRFVILGDGFPQLMKHLLALLVGGDGVEGASCLRVVWKVFVIKRSRDPIHPF